MQLDPKIAMWIKIILALLTAITTGTLSFTGLVSPSVATQIVAYAGVALTVLSIVMSAYSSSAPGPLAPPDPPAVVHAQAEVDAQAARAAADKAAAISAAHGQAITPAAAPSGLSAAAAASKAVAIFVLALLVLALLGHGVAYAESASAKHRLGVPPNPIHQYPNAGPIGDGSGAATQTTLESVAQKSPQIVLDLETADSLAAWPLPAAQWTASNCMGTWASGTCSTPEIWDPLAHLCIPAAVAFLESMPTPGSTPQPAAGATVGVFTVLEEGVEKLDALQGFIATVAQVGYPVALHAACDAEIRRLGTLPISVGAAAITDMNTFLASLAKTAIP